MLRMQQLPCQDSLLLVLVGIEGGNALLGGAVLLVLQALLLQLVLEPVPGHEQRCPVTDFEAVGGDGHALGGHLLHLLPEVLRVQGHAVSQNVHNPLAKNAGGQQVQGKFAVLVDDGVTGVSAALVTDDHIIVLGQKVYHPSLSLVTPVDTHNGTVGICHIYQSFTVL